MSCHAGNISIIGSSSQKAYVIFHRLFLAAISAYAVPVPFQIRVQRLSSPLCVPPGYILKQPIYAFKAQFIKHSPLIIGYLEHTVPYLSLLCSTLHIPSIHQAIQFTGVFHFDYHDPVFIRIFVYKLGRNLKLGIDLNNCSETGE